jgi:membrane-associated phospholipid phosphatase
MHIRENPRIPALAGVAVASAAAFAALTVLERDRRLTKSDKKALEKIAKRYEKHEEVAASLHPLGKWYWYVPAAAAAGATVYARGSGRRRERAAGAAALLLAAGAGALVNPLFDKILPQPPPPPGRKVDRKPSFPSGHAFGLGGVAMTAAYVLRREKVIGPAAAIPLALLPPVIGGVAKIIEKKHWPSEVAGGLLVGAVIASLSALVYELERAEPSGEAGESGPDTSREPLRPLPRTRPATARAKPRRSPV